MTVRPGTWRAKAACVIERVLKETRGTSEKDIRAALRDAYPFGERAMWPYQVWLDEIKVQRKQKRAKPRRRKGQPVQVPPQKEVLF